VPNVEGERVRHPLRESAYRALWTANVIGNIGVWMQGVAGAWLMTNLTNDAFPVALMQTATTLPAFLVGLPAGSLADRMDRRFLLLLTQVWMFITVLVLALLTQLNMVTPWVLLTCTFALGSGAAMNAPTWAALLPDVVSRPQVPTAISMNSAGYNMARAIGPAIGGFIVALVGAAATFALNAAAFAMTFGIVFSWKQKPVARVTNVQRETFARTILTGLRYAWSTDEQRLVLIRTTVWMICAGALWGLLPLVARRELGLDAPGYGLLVTCVGVGAVVGSFCLPWLRRRLSTNRVLLMNIVIFTVMLLTMAWVSSVPLVCLTLALGGSAWTTSNQSFQIAVQMGAPAWVRARAIAVYLLIFQGGLAIGSALWGAVAEHSDDRTALTCAAFGLLLGLVVAIRWPVGEPQ
jgi:MFS family permease